MDKEKRQYWLKTLACSQLKDIEALFNEAELEIPTFQYLRKPETGLYMVRGRMGGEGDKFNFGEVSVSRCAIKLDNKYIGVSYVRGTSKRHCEFSAIIDAMLQDDKKFGVIWEKVIKPASKILKDNLKKEAEKRDKTRVEFFTMG